MELPAIVKLSTNKGVFTVKVGYLYFRCNESITLDAKLSFLESNKDKDIKFRATSIHKPDVRVKLITKSHGTIKYIKGFSKDGSKLIFTKKESEAVNLKQDDIVNRVMLMLAFTRSNIEFLPKSNKDATQHGRDREFFCVKAIEERSDESWKDDCFRGISNTIH